MDSICKYHAGDFRLFGHLFGYTNVAIIPMNGGLENKKVPFPLLKIKNHGG